MTRRSFLTLLGVAGGAGAVYGAMDALGLIHTSRPTRFGLSRTGAGPGTRVLILGGGLAGLTTAYELGKLGYECRILEARGRVGGRCHTVRGGVTETEADGQTQTAAFDEGLYFNVGPARIPQHHVTLDYCRELGVPIEAFGNANEAAYYYNEGVGPLSGRRVRIREAKTDLAGYTAELLAKAVSQNTLDLPLSTDDEERLLTFLRTTSGLNADNVYGHGTPLFDRRGYHDLPGAGSQAGTFDDPLPLPALLQGGFGRFLASEYVFDWQMMMFQVVGGMDRLAQAFEQRVRPAITSGAEVQEIRQETQGVRVVYRDDGGRSQQVTADYGVCTIPLSVLRRIPADFTPEMTRAIAGIAYAPSCKVGLQFRRRFWEEDDHIFSGITHTNQSIGQILYPSYGYLGRKGLLVGCYNFGAAAAQMSKQAPARRIADALAQGTKIHPQYAQEYETGFSIAWRNVPYSLGGWAGYTDETRRDLYPALNRPDGRWLLAGEHMSYLTGWMAGAFESARVAVTAVHERVSAPL